MDLQHCRIWNSYFFTEKLIRSLPRIDVVVEEIQNNPEYCFDGAHRHDPGGQLLITLSGVGGLRCGTENLQLTAGMAFLHNHNDQNICYYYPPGGTESWHFLWIGFSGSAAEEIIDQINNLYGYIFYPGAQSPLVEELMSMRRFSLNGHTINPLSAAELIFKLLNMLISDTKPQNIQHIPPRQLLKKAINFIDRHIGYDLNVNTIADSLQISREHLSRTFRSHMNMTIKKYIQDKQLTMARDLLFKTSLSCNEIALRCGFSDSSSLGRAFKKHWDLSPQQLRNQSNSYRH